MARAWTALLVALASGGAARGDLEVLRSPPPSEQERYCAWFGQARGEVLYFGEAAFWSAFRAGGDDPEGDLRAAGPQRIGRVDLAEERLLPPLDVTVPGARSGVWDVLPHPNGRVYFTTFFESAGWVDPATGVHARLPELGAGLAELALGPDGDLLAARYARPGHPEGSIVRFSPDGRRVAEHPLRGPDGWRVAPKSVAYDPVRQEIWALTDLLPVAGGPPRHDARVLDRAGRERLRLEAPEVQFASFAGDGTGYLAEREGPALYLRILPPGGGGAPLASGRRLLLDVAFPAGLDFLQDLQIAPDGRVVATRWSGRVHVVDAAAERPVADVALPRIDPEGLYYTGVVRGRRLCATWCSDVTVVCKDVPAAAAHVPAGAPAPPGGAAVPPPE